MRKTLTISGRKVELDGSNGWAFVYREQFGHDILPDVLPALEAILEVAAAGVDLDTTDWRKVLAATGEDSISSLMISLSGLEVTTMFGIVWAMAKNADPDIEDPVTWMNSFATFPIDKIVMPVIELLVRSNISTKKANSLLKSLKEIPEKAEKMPE